MIKKILSAVFVVSIFAAFAQGQTAEVKMSLSEQFFDALLEAVFTNLEPPAFPISEFRNPVRNSNYVAVRRASFGDTTALSFGFGSKSIRAPDQKMFFQNARCVQSIKLQREIGGVKTAVRFRAGRIYAPIAFTGAYNPPFVGCLEFRGWAETIVELFFDRERQSLVGRARVSNVRLEGVPDLASGILTPLVQSAIDRRVNPIQILPLEKISFVVPVENSGAIRMKAIGLRHEIGESVLNVYINYEFKKAN